MEEYTNNSIPRLDHVIEKIEIATGIANIFDKDYAEKISSRLKYTRNELEGMPPKELIYLSIDLSRYIIYIQNCIARTKAKLHYYNIEIDRWLGTFMEQEFPDIYGASNKRITAIMSKDETRKVFSMLQIAQTTLSRLEGVVDGIKLYQKDINDLKIMKLSEQKMERNNE